MKTATERSMKSSNMKWLVMLAVLDTFGVMAFVVPEVVEGTTLTKLAAMRALAAAFLPVLVLLLTGLTSPNLKAVLVYWRVRNTLPGCKAFTKYAPADLRIDMSALKKHVGVLPTDPAEQNAKWYRLYKMVADENAVVEAHKLFLMFRDMAAMSLPLILVVPLSIRFAAESEHGSCIAAVLLAVQYLVCALGARHNGNRLVTNVLAIHSARKVTIRKSTPST